LSINKHDIKALPECFYAMLSLKTFFHIPTLIFQSDTNGVVKWYKSRGNLRHFIV